MAAYIQLIFYSSEGTVGLMQCAGKTSHGT